MAIGAAVVVLGIFFGELASKFRNDFQVLCSLISGERLSIFRWVALFASCWWGENSHVVILGNTCRVLGKWNYKGLKDIVLLIICICKIILLMYILMRLYQCFRQQLHTTSSNLEHMVWRQEKVEIGEKLKRAASQCEHSCIQREKLQLLQANQRG